MDLGRVVLVFAAAVFALVSLFFGLLAVLIVVDALSCSGIEVLLRLLLAIICGAGSAVAAAGAAAVLEEVLG